MIKSKILKIAILLIEIILFFVISLIFLLMYGIKIDTISYNDINATQLYIKYDKNLMVKVDKLNIAGNVIDLTTHIEYRNEHLLLHFENVAYEGTDLHLKGDVTLSKFDLEELFYQRKTNIKLENIEFVYDKNIKPLYAKNLFLEYKNNEIYISFTKPILNGIKLDKSTVVLKNLHSDFTVHLQLYSATLLNKPVKEILSYYKITIPLEQTKGINDLFVDLSIPINNVQNIKSYVKVKSKESSVNLDGTLILSDDLFIEYKNDTVSINSNSGKINFNEYLFTYNDLNGSLKNNILSIDTNIKDQFLNGYHSITKTNFYANTTNGELFVNNFKYQKLVEIKNKKIPYTLNIDQDKIFITSKPLELEYFKKNQHHKIKIEKLNKLIPYIKFVKNKKDNNSSLVLSTNDNFNSFNMEINDLYIDINSSQLEFEKSQNKSAMPKIKISSNKGLISYDNFTLPYNDFIVSNLENNFVFSSYLHDKIGNKYLIDTTYNSENKKFNGYLVFFDFNYKNLVKTDVIACDFGGYIDENRTKITSELLDMVYEKDNLKQSVVVNHLENIFAFLPMANINDAHKASSLKVYTEDSFKTTNVILNNIIFDLNSSEIFGKEKNKEDTKLNLPSIDIRAFDTIINYDNFLIDSSVVESKIARENINLQVIPRDKNGTFLFKKFNNEIEIEAQNISSEFVNSLIGKDKFKNGYFEAKLDGDMHTIKGYGKMNKTTVQNVTVLNNLITFVNTTPAIYNPILALPTLFRLGETGFDLNGYYVDGGDVQLDIDMDKKILTMPYIKTKSKMTDFKGKGWVDFKNKNMEFNMDVIFLKDFSKAINHIPIVNYIVLGKEGNFVTQVDIKGTFDEQSFETHTVKNTSSGVVNVIKRTLSLPFLPFMNDSNSTNNITEEEKQNLLRPKSD